MSKTLAVATVGSLIFCRENQHTPTDRDWDDFLRVMVESQRNFPYLRVLVLTDGGGPNAAQRERLGKALQGHSVRVAVVSNSSKVRFIVSAIAFLTQGIETFSRSELKRAFEHLNLSTAEQTQAEETLMRLEATIDPNMKG